MKKISRAILALGALLCVAALFFGLYTLSRPQTVPGVKTITVEVVHKDTSSRSFTFWTDEEYLGAALMDEGLVLGEPGPYGLYIQWVDGESADYDVDKSYWALFEGEEYATQSADQTVIEDGDHFRLVYTIG